MAIKKTSMQDIADYLGISKNSVSLALRDMPGISPGLKEKVIEAAVKHNYAGYGRQKPASQVQDIVVIVPEYVSRDSSFHQKLIFGMERYGTSIGVHVVIRTISNEQEKKKHPPGMIDNLNVKGFILIGDIGSSYIKMIKAMK